MDKLTREMEQTTRGIAQEILTKHPELTISEITEAVKYALICLNKSRELPWCIDSIPIQNIVAERITNGINSKKTGELVYYIGSKEELENSGGRKIPRKQLIDEGFTADELKRIDDGEMIRYGLHSHKGTSNELVWAEEA